MSRRRDARGGGTFRGPLPRNESPAPEKRVSERRVESSRDSPAGAGWECEEPGAFTDLVPPGRRRFSWLSPSALWEARNEVVARRVGDPTNELRRRWVARLRGGGLGTSPEGFVMDRYSDVDSFGFVLLGDPGEGDASQFALVPPLLAQARDTLFMLISSDVVYPAGDVNQYEEKFYLPYKDYPGPVYAVPGNHDWYDGLNGFMAHFCGAEPTSSPRLPPGSGPLLRLLWRAPTKADPEVLERCRSLRPTPTQRLDQPGPYFAIETKALRIVGVDAGIRGEIDREQGEWLRRVSASPKPKVLVLGEPIYADGEYRPTPIEGGGTVDEVVRAREHNYVAVLSGDKHNYQRYPVKVEEGRTIQHVVSGGGGAFTHATHKIPRVDLPGVEEEDFVCYPRRGDSLSFYGRLYDRWLGFGRGWLRVPPDEAAVIMAERLGVDPARPSDRGASVGDRSRRAARRVLPLPGSGPLHPVFSEVFDWNEPPLFKNFLKARVERDRLSLTCFGVTGCREHEREPPVEDHVEIALQKRP